MGKKPRYKNRTRCIINNKRKRIKSSKHGLPPLKRCAYTSITDLQKYLYISYLQFFDMHKEIPFVTAMKTLGYELNLSNPSPCEETFVCTKTDNGDYDTIGFIRFTLNDYTMQCLLLL